MLLLTPFDPIFLLVNILLVVGQSVCRAAKDVHNGSLTHYVDCRTISPEKAQLDDLYHMRTSSIPPQKRSHLLAEYSLPHQLYRKHLGLAASGCAWTKMAMVVNHNSKQMGE